MNLFGSKVEVLDLKIPKGKKFESRTYKCFLVGYRSTGCIVYDHESGALIETCNFRCYETEMYKDNVKLPSQEPLDFGISCPEGEKSEGKSSAPNSNPKPNENNDLNSNDGLDSSSSAEEVTIEIDDDWEEEKSQPLECKSLKVMTEKSFDYESNMNSNDLIPDSYNQAMSLKYRKDWEGPILSELRAMEKYKVWEIVPRTKEMPVIPMKWVFTEKDDGTKKARLVVVGCNDKEVYSAEDKASPTPSASMVRLIFCLASKEGWDMDQLDIGTAFLNGKIDREKYVTIPDGVNADKKKFACHLKKALYGLATAPKCWNTTFNECITEMGFVPSLRDSCLYSKSTEGKVTLLLIHVDDIILTGNDPETRNEVIEGLKRKFEVKILGYPKRFLGLQVEKNCDGKVFIHQTGYTTAMLKEFGMAESNGKPTPMLPIANHKSMKVSEEDRKFSYKSAVGALLYLCNFTRPDIAFAVGYLARFQVNPELIHWTLMNRIFRYLKLKTNLGILFEGRTNEFDVFVDADFAADRSRKSTTGFLIRAFGDPIAWSSKKQKTIAESTAEAEYVAICQAIQELLFITRSCEENLSLKIEYPIRVYEDNIAALRKCNSNVSKGRLKYVEQKYLKTREYVTQGIIKIVKVDTKAQLADCLTKPLNEDLFVKCRDKIMSYLEEH
jgi:hypothetical protein